MNVQEFSAEFDVLYNNITSNQAPGLNEYEKSVFLTKAQSQLINEYFNQRTDGVWGGFDGSQRRQYDFSSLIKIASPVNITSATSTLDRRGIVFVFPKDFFLSVNEVLYDGYYQYSILPINYAEYQRLMLKPYNFPVKRAAWRLFKGAEYYNEYSDEENQDGIHARKGADYYFAFPSFNRKNTNLSISVNSGYVSVDSDWTSSITTDVIDSLTNSGTNAISVTPSVSDNGSETVVTLDIDINTITEKHDDNAVLGLIKQAYIQLLERFNKGEVEESAETIRSGIVLDWMQNTKAPIGRKQFTEGTYTITTSIVEGATSAEIIGKFRDIIKYQLRYIPKLKPIILEDLDNYGTDLTIDGESGYTECILPEETHREILERAVTLAKIAWQGGTMTQAAQAAQQQDRR